MYKQLCSYLAPKVECRVIAYGRGIFARELLYRGELIAAWGGRIVTGEMFDELEETSQSLCVQVEDDLFLVPRELGPGDYVNHSCNPNAGILGQMTLVAMRDIQAGEEICYDYAMSDGCDYDEFDCQCGESNCRKKVTGNDWMLSELWEKYEGYFSPYLQRRIDRLRKNDYPRKVNPS